MIAFPSILIDAMTGRGVHLGRWLRSPIELVDVDGRILGRSDESYFPLMHFASMPLTPKGHGTLLVLMRNDDGSFRVVRAPTVVHDMGLSAVVAT